MTNPEIHSGGAEAQSTIVNWKSEIEKASSFILPPTDSKSSKGLARNVSGPPY